VNPPKKVPRGEIFWEDGSVAQGAKPSFR